MIEITFNLCQNGVEFVKKLTLIYIAYTTYIVFF